MRRAVFLDRDGVLIDHNGSVFSGAVKQLRRLKDAGFFLGMVTNQPDIATGKITRQAVDRVNANLACVLPLDAMSVCPHVDADKCDCRKPKAGMVKAMAKVHDLDISRSFLIGDRWRDISAAYYAGCPGILIGTGYAEPFPHKPDFRAGDLEVAADFILETA